jgi:predicted dehydrogenase
LVGVSEDDPKIRAALSARGIPLLDRDALLKHAGIDVVAVESAVRDHARDGVAALRAGKHVHLEKAPAHNLQDFRTIAALARERGRLLQVGYMWRYHPGVEKLLEAARNGWLGSIYLVKGFIGNQLEGARRPEWAEFAGGLMFELGGHVIDPLVRLLGKPLKITPYLRKDGAFADSLKDNTAAVFEWNSAIGFVHGSTLQPGSNRFRAIEIHGTNGTGVLRPIEPGDLNVYLDKPAGPYIKGPQKVPLPPYSRYIDDFAELAAAVRGQATLRVSIDEDLVMHEALLRASGMI